MDDAKLTKPMMTLPNPFVKAEPAMKLRHRSRASESEHTDNGEPPSEHTGPQLGNKGFEHNSGNLCSDKNTGEKGKSMLGYFMTELTKHYRLEADASEFVERRDRVYTSVNTPKNLEKFLAFGFLQCLDSILYMATFLPLRILVALMRLLAYPCTFVIVGRHRPPLDASQVCDLLKGLILVVSCYVTSQVDMSMIYHIVRGQSIMKFYVFFNMLDVMDKLVSQFGQDILDSLYWTAVEPRGRKREHFGTLFHLVFATVYVIAHTLMILMQAIILNVAFNSHNKNLLTVMMSNNFVEIKVNVFKRVDKTNLCQITYSDVRERFHYLVLLFFVFVRNMKELQWNWDMALPLLQDAAIVFVVEVFVDWIKHAFITKLSELSASHYGEFSLGLAQDIASSQKKHAFTNFSDQVCRRMGFTPMPLICLLYMVCSSSFTVEGPLAWLIVFMLYICLTSTKVLNSIILLGWAQRLITERDRSAQSTGTVVNSQTHPKKEVVKKPAAPKAEPPTVIPVTTLTHSDTSVCTQPMPTESLSNQLNVASSSSLFKLPAVISTNSSSAPRPEGTPSTVEEQTCSMPNLQASSSHGYQSGSVSHQSHNSHESSSHNGLQRDANYPQHSLLSSQGHQPGALTALNFHGLSTPSFTTATISPPSNPHHITTNLVGLNLSSPNPPSTVLSVSPPPPSFMTNAAITPLTTATDSAPLSNSPSPHPSSPAPPSLVSTVEQVDQNSSFSTPSTTSAPSDQSQTSSVRSPKRKHSGSSINSADSFLLENSDPGHFLASDAAILDNLVTMASSQERLSLTEVVNPAAPPVSGKDTYNEELSQPVKLPSSNAGKEVSSQPVSEVVAVVDTGPIVTLDAKSNQVTDSTKDLALDEQETNSVVNYPRESSC